MDHLDELIARVLVREGGAAYTNDPNDNGGPTKYGITLGALYTYRRTPVSAEDVKVLTEAEAVAIYRRNYFPPGLEMIPAPAVLELLFDFGVNSGPVRAMKALQTVLQRNGTYTGGIDGDIGPKSLAAIRSTSNWEAMFYAIKCERYEAYMRFAGSDPRQQIYLNGWSNRQDQFEMKFAAAATAAAASSSSFA